MFQDRSALLVQDKRSVEGAQRAGDAQLFLNLHKALSDSTADQRYDDSPLVGFLNCPLRSRADRVVGPQERSVDIRADKFDGGHVFTLEK